MAGHQSPGPPANQINRDACSIQQPHALLQDTGQMRQQVIAHARQHTVFRPVGRPYQVIAVAGAHCRVERLAVEIHRFQIHPGTGQMHQALPMLGMKTIEHLQQPAHGQRRGRLQAQRPTLPTQPFGTQALALVVIWCVIDLSILLAYSLLSRYIAAYGSIQRLLDLLPSAFLLGLGLTSCLLGASRMLE